jgi:hypothetical protein
VGREIVADRDRLFRQPAAGNTKQQVVEQRIGRGFRMLVHVIRGVEARMRIAQFGSAHLQVVQQRVLRGIRHVRVVRQIPGAVEEPVRIAALGGAIVHKMMQRIGTGGTDIGIARQVPVGIEKSGQRVAKIGDGGRFWCFGRRRHAGRFPVQPVASGRYA